MYLWRRSVTPQWWRQNATLLRELAGEQLAVIERPQRKRFQLEVAVKSRRALEGLVNQFRGRIDRLPRNWLKRSLRYKTKPIKLGNRKLIIPAGAAFGTGEHATTAMSLRLLERISRDLKRGWSLVDLGTGSGILVLAARLLGAKRAVGIDHDPRAISTAKQNAKLNKIFGVHFRIDDVRYWRSPQEIEIVTANLFSELLIQIVANLKPARRLILSGILREQEQELRRVLTRHQIHVVEVRRRGKWVAMLAASR